MDNLFCVGAVQRSSERERFRRVAVSTADFISFTVLLPNFIILPSGDHAIMHVKPGIKDFEIDINHVKRISIWMRSNHLVEFNNPWILQVTGRILISLRAIAQNVLQGSVLS